MRLICKDNAFFFFFSPISIENLTPWLATRFARLVRGRFFLTTNRTNQTNVLPYEAFAHHTTIADSGIQFVAKVVLCFYSTKIQI